MNLSLKKLAFPIYIDMLLRVSTAIINTYMVTLLNVNLVGSLGAGNQIWSFGITIFSFLSIGCSVIISQALGARNKTLAYKTIHTSITFNILIGFTFSLLVFFFGYEILEFLNVPQAQILDSYKYLHIISYAIFFEAISMVMGAILRVYNFASYTMKVSIIMNILTVILNSIFLFGFFGLPKLGIFGIGLGTTLARFTAMLLLTLAVIKIAKVKLSTKKLFKFEREIIKKILLIGAPAAGENMLWLVQYMTFFAFIGKMGSNPLNVQTIYFQLTFFIMISGSAISLANEIIVGRFCGARKFDEAYKRAFSSLYISIFTTFCLTILVFTFQNPIMSFMHSNEEMREIMKKLFFLSLYLEFIRTFNIMFVNSLRAAGDARYPLYLAIFSMIIFSIPFGYFLAFHLKLGVLGIWLAFATDETIRGILNLRRWKSRKWESKILV